MEGYAEGSQFVRARQDMLRSRGPAHGDAGRMLQDHDSVAYLSGKTTGVEAHLEIVGARVLLNSEIQPDRLAKRR